MHVGSEIYYTQCKGWKPTSSKIDFPNVFQQDCTETEVNRITVEFDSIVQKYFKQIFQA